MDVSFDSNKELDEYLQLAKKGLTSFPTSLLGKCKNIKYCYLEANTIEELPETFFQAMPHLQWLDLRNNNLEKLPTDGLNGQSKLEILLLQNNRIKMLPYQLAFLPRLRGLQIIGNPIENVPFERLAAGLPALLVFLKNLAHEQDSLLPVSETIITNPCHKEYEVGQINGNANAMPRTKVSKEKNDFGVVLNVKSYSTRADNGRKIDQPKETRKRKGLEAAKACTKVASACNVLRRRCKTASNDKLISPEKIQAKEENLRQRARLCETLSRQSQMLQRLKDAETVKQWRMTKSRQEDQKLLDNFQIFPCRNFTATTPFDIDRDMMQMMSRKDIYLSLKQWEQKKKRQAERRLKSPGGKIRDVESQMGELTEQLRMLDLEIHEEREIAKKRSNLASRIEQINQLRRVLKHLQGKNLLP